MKRSGFQGLAAVLILFSTGAQAWPTLELEPAQDNTIYETAIDSGDNLVERSNGQGFFLFVGRTGFDGGFKRRRALLKFDTGALPEDVVIVSVKVILYQSKAAPGSPPVSIGLHALTEEWGEGESKAIAPEGQGDFAATGDATWHHRLHPDTLWSTAGGAYAAVASSSVTVGEDAGYFTWVCTPALLADVQAWQADPASNYGWVVVGGEDSGQSAHKFYSHENVAVSERPRLIITFRTTDDVAQDGFEDFTPCG